MPGKGAWRGARSLLLTRRRDFVRAIEIIELGATPRRAAVVYRVVSSIKLMMDANWTALHRSPPSSSILISGKIAY